uniref:Calcineurin-like phosphoesterase domain-containing protein n=1 Tax=Aegilops tauschii subsp. strangulata TaxID=200361 RepID=A0A453GLG4_AEGTS
MRWWLYRLAAAAAFLAAALALRSPAPLRFASGGRFKVALFADLHYGENAWTDWGPAQDAASDHVMATVLDADKPDFVVYLGDLVTANNVPIPNATLYWDRAISHSRRRGVPWSTVFGNHDDMPFEWPPEWFSPAGIPPVHCLSAAAMQTSVRVQLQRDAAHRADENRAQPRRCRRVIALVGRAPGALARRLQLRSAGALAREATRPCSAHVFPRLGRWILPGSHILCTGPVVR